MGMSDSPIITSTFHSQLLRQGELVVIVTVVMAVAWNVLHTLQYRRAAARGEPGVTWRSDGVEPLGRRVLRVGFGVLWVIDGFLQLQPGMPLGLPSDVLKPGASSSPGWVRSLVGVGFDAWSRHPTEAAAAVVWIQLGIGLFLLVAPRGRWSRTAGLVSAGWGLVVWAFGESFGGLFAPGLTILSGAPGAVLFYVVGGGLLALPDRAWVTRRLGRIVTGSLGVFFVVMACLQAWPGRGFWQGEISGRPGTLAGLLSRAARTQQPHVFASIVSSFTSFDEAHGAEVNLFVVAVLALIGLAFVTGRLVLPALVALSVFGLADWVVVQDLGVFGGVGTDPNSMVPMLLMAVAGYLATVRVPVDAPMGGPEPVAPVPAPVTADRGDVRRPWWDRVEPGYAARLAGAVVAVVIVLLGTAPLVAAAVNPRADAVLAESVDGSPAVVSGPAPDFHLVDQTGRPVSLTDLRGYTVALTFLDPVCTTDCPVIAQEFRVASDMLGLAASRVRFVAVVANPTFNSVSDVAAFDRQEGLSSQSNWLFLTGSRSALESVWNDYGAAVYNAPAGAMVAHSDLAYIIDAHGTLRRALNTDPGAAGPANQSSFSGVLAGQITEVMRS